MRQRMLPWVEPESQFHRTWGGQARPGLRLPPGVERTTIRPRATERHIMVTPSGPGLQRLVAGRSGVREGHGDRAGDGRAAWRGDALANSPDLAQALDQ